MAHERTSYFSGVVLPSCEIQGFKLKFVWSETHSCRIVTGRAFVRQLYLAASSHHLLASRWYHPRLCRSDEMMWSRRGDGNGWSGRENYAWRASHVTNSIIWFFRWLEIARLGDFVIRNYQNFWWNWYRIQPTRWSFIDLSWGYSWKRGNYYPQRHTSKWRLKN